MRQTHYFGFLHVLPISSNMVPDASTNANEKSEHLNTKLNDLGSSQESYVGVKHVLHM